MASTTKQEYGALAIRPFSRFGTIDLKGAKVRSFEKEGSSADSSHSKYPEKKTPLPELTREYQEIKLFLQATTDVKPLDSTKIKEASKPSPKKYRPYA